MTIQLKSCLSCPNSMVLVLTETVDAGSFPACFTDITQLVRRLDAMYKPICLYLKLLLDYIYSRLHSTFGTFKDDLITRYDR